MATRNVFLIQQITFIILKKLLDIFNTINQEERFEEKLQAKMNGYEINIDMEKSFNVLTQFFPRDFKKTAN